MRYSPDGITLVISPHLDDAVLGCWSVIDHHQTVTILTVFAGIPKEGSYQWDVLCGEPNSADMMRRRRIEDATVADQSGADFLHLDMLDHQYLNRDIGDIEVLRSSIEALDLEVSQIYAPIAAGGYMGEHPDHYVVRQMALSLLADYPVLFYADLPYALSRRWPKVAPNRLYLPTLYSYTPTVVRLTDSETERKLLCMKNYESQLSLLNKLSGGQMLNPNTYNKEVFWKAEKAGAPAPRSGMRDRVFRKLSPVSASVTDLGPSSFRERKEFT